MVLAKAGYALDFIYHAKGGDKGLWDLDPFGSKNTASLLLKAPSLTFWLHWITKAKTTVWLDNLFTDSRVLEVLRDRNGCGAAGTVRTLKTKRDLMEEGLSESDIDSNIEAIQINSSGSDLSDYLSDFDEITASIVGYPLRRRDY